MPLPSSPNQITLNQILQEKQGNTTARTNVSLRGLSVDGVNDSSGGDDINIALSLGVDVLSVV